MSFPHCSFHYYFYHPSPFHMSSYHHPYSMVAGACHEYSPYHHLYSMVAEACLRGSSFALLARGPSHGHSLLQQFLSRSESH